MLYTIFDHLLHADTLHHQWYDLMCHCANTQNQAMCHFQHDIPIPIQSPLALIKHRMECRIPSTKSSKMHSTCSYLVRKDNSQSYCHHSPNKAHIKHTIEQHDCMMLCLEYLIVEGVMGLLHICYHH